MNARILALCAGLACAGSLAAAPDPGQRLNGELTPLGGERAGNAAGSIPAWSGGLASAPSCHRAGARWCDPYAQDRPLATIGADNLDAWRAQLSDGQVDLMLRHPGTYAIRVFPSRRSFANPPAVYAATRENAKQAVLMPSGREVRDARIGIPFPITDDGVAMAWNHRLRYRGPGYRRWIQQAAVSATGDISLVKLREDTLFPYATGDKLKNDIAQYWLRIVFEPERLAGAITLVHESLNHEDEPSVAWQRGYDTPMFVRERNYGFDTLAAMAENLRMDDQLDTWFGSPERYTWKVLAKREMVVPYNSYALHNRGDVRDMLRPGHLSPALTRYELHRVWIVDGNTKPSAVHRIKRRRFYIDEDSWQILMVDCYDNDGRLWRWQETHTVMSHDHPTLVPVAEVVHDLQADRFVVQAIADDEAPAFEPRTFERGHFGRAGAQKASRERDG